MKNTTSYSTNALNDENMYYLIMSDEIKKWRWSHVLDDRLAVFVSIPKCASKTILNKFDIGSNRDWEGDALENSYIAHENHQRLAVLESRYELKNKFVFCFVRHPYDRVKSWYDYHFRFDCYESNLNQWVQSGCRTHWKIQNQTQWNNDNLSPLLQYNFIDANTKVDFIGKIESFEDDCEKLRVILNSLFEKNQIPKRIKKKEIWKNRSIRTSEELNQKSKEKIYQLFRKDFEYFGYSK